MNRILANVVSGAMVSVSLLAPVTSWAQAAPAQPAPMPTHGQPTQAQMDEARSRYERALELSDEGNYDEALLELQRAYALAPTYRLLYNLGVVSAAVHDYVKAIDYFERYLTEGGPAIEPARATEVQQQLDRLRMRVARIRIYASVPNAQVSVDDVPVGKAPIETPLTVNSGRHRVTASAPGYFPSTQVIELAGNDSRAISLKLQVVSTEKPSHPIPWLGYGITAALAAGATVTGILALNASSKYDTKVNTLGTSASDIKSSYDGMRALSVTTDVLLVGAIVAAGISIYLTVKPVKAKPVTTGLALSPNGLTF